MEFDAMTIDWDSYELYDAGFVGRPNSLPRAQAREAFKRHMDTKSVRMEMFRRLLEINGLELETSDDAIQDLNNWFFTNVEPDPERPGMLMPAWYSIVHDVALFLGEVMIKRNPNLHWEFFIWGKSDVSYQRHVIMGFSTEDPKFHTNMDLERMVAAYAHKIIEKRGSVPVYGTVEIRGTPVDVDAVAARHRDREIETDAFWRWLEIAAHRA